MSAKDSTVIQPEQVNELKGEEAMLVGVSSALREQLITLDMNFGEAVVVNAYAQYVFQEALAGEQDPRAVWNEFVGNLRDVYFAIAGLKNDG